MQTTKFLLKSVHFLQMSFQIMNTIKKNNATIKGRKHEKKDFIMNVEAPNI